MPLASISGLNLSPTRSLASFVGRATESAEIEAALRRQDLRLLTLVGPGGVGKTTLALACAMRVADAFPDGVFSVLLSSLRDHHLVITEVARATGVQPLDQDLLVAHLSAHLGKRQLLLVIDNIEHLLECVSMLKTLLATCPGVKMLVTSRIPLDIPEESTFSVRPLPTPDLPAIATNAPSVAEALTYDAIQLFVARGREVNPDFDLTEDNLPVVAEICTRLDGLPLAIELAAARLATIPPSLLLNRLRARLPILTNQRRDAPDRHRTMRDAIAWSYALLSPADRALFRRIAIFPGDFTLAHVGGLLQTLAPLAKVDSPEVTIASTTAAISTLVHHSLLRIDLPDMHTEDSRYLMLATLREFGVEQLVASGEETTIREAHARWTLGFTEQIVAGVQERDSTGTTDLLDRNGDNIRQALDWLVTQRDADASLRLASMFSRVWLDRGPYAEGRSWLERVLTLDSASPDTQLPVRVALTQLTARSGDFASALPHGEQALIDALTIGDQSAIAQSSLAIAYITSRLGNLDRAAALTQTALAIYRDRDDLSGAAEAFTQMAYHAMRDGQMTLARNWAEDARDTWRQLDNRRGEIVALDLLSLISRLSHDLVRQAMLIRTLLDLSREITDPYQLGSSLWTAAAIAGERNHHAEAARFFGAEESLRERTGYIIDPAFIEDYRRGCAETRDALGLSAFTARWDAGRRLVPMQALTEAIVLLDEIVIESERDAQRQSDAFQSLGITPRQQEVLLLLIEGRSDREIAQQLGISQRTASKHVGTLLIRLGTSSRTGAATTAARLGIGARRSGTGIDRSAPS